MKELGERHAAVLKGTTIFLQSVKSPTKVARLLQPGQQNAKLGGMIKKGKWSGMPIYSLTLEERKTCPKTCDQWRTCYGNNMPFANRIDHQSRKFFGELEQEVKVLASKHSGGFVVRLHVLGDFYSMAYVRFWEALLLKHKNLRIFGYTHRQKDTPIGRAISSLNTMGAWVRWSDAGGSMSANVEGEGITCPEQLGKTKSCSTCGLCWSTPLAINFLRH